jgi:hypothetical protein
MEGVAEAAGRGVAGAALVRGAALEADALA